MKTLTLAGLALVIVVMALSVFNAPGPALALDPTLDAALYAIAQATAQAGQVIAAQRATAAAVNSEATRQANNSQATARALSAEATAQAFAVQSTAQAQSASATQSAMDELTRQRAMTATTQHDAIVATTTALAQSAKATATAEAMNAQAMATSQAVTGLIQSAQATDTARLSATYATRQNRFTWGLLAVEIFFLCGAAWVLWKLSGTLAAWAVKMRPQTERPLSGLIASAAQPSVGNMVIDQAREPEPRMPEVEVIDNPAMEAAISQWAERYDVEHGVNYGNGNE